jgi:molecular chaperone GrpE
MNERPEAQQDERNPGTPASGKPGDHSPGGSLEAEDVPGSGSQQEGDHPAAAEGGKAAHRDPADPSLVLSDLDDLSRATSEQSTRPDIEAERDEYLELAQRTKADFENYRKRVAGEAASAQRRGKAELAGELVPVLDNLERALHSADIDPLGEPVDGALEQGIVLTYRDLRETLERAGVEAYDPGGEKFDPELHEAISTRAAGDAEPGTVVDVAQKGYRIDGQVIRPARVVVGE